MTVDLVPDGTRVVIVARTRTTGRTGVEMEALTAVAIAGLTLHDMMKAVDPRATLTGVQLDREDRRQARPLDPRHVG